MLTELPFEKRREVLSHFAPAVVNLQQITHIPIAAVVASRMPHIASKDECIACRCKHYKKDAYARRFQNSNTGGSK